MVFFLGLMMGLSNLVVVSIVDWGELEAWGTWLEMEVCDNWVEMEAWVVLFEVGSGIEGVISGATSSDWVESVLMRSSKGNRALRRLYADVVKGMYHELRVRLHLAPSIFLIVIMLSRV